MRMNSHTVKFDGKPINLSQISRETGYSVSHLSKIFSGKREPSIRVLKILAEYLNTTTDKFLDLI